MQGYIQALESSAIEYLSARAPSGFSENQYAQFKTELQTLARSRFINLVGEELAQKLMSQLESALETRISPLLEQANEIYTDNEKKLNENDPQAIYNATNVLQILIHESISRIIGEILSDAADDSVEKYHAIEQVLGLINSDRLSAISRGELVAKVSQVKKIRSIARLVFSLPDSQTEERETLATREQKLIMAQKELVSIKETQICLELNPDISFLEEKVQLALEDVQDPEKQPLTLERDVDQEVSRRHERMIDQFCLAIDSQLRQEEETLFQQYLVGHSLPQPRILDVFESGYIPVRDSLEWRLWNEWLRTQTLPEGCALTQLQTYLPQDALTVLSQQNSRQILELKMKFQQFLDERTTSIGVINSMLLRGMRELQIIERLQAPPFSYTPKQANDALKELLKIKNANKIKIDQARSFLVEQFQYPAEAGGRANPKNLQYWQIQKYFSETGFVLSVEELGKILSLNISKQQLYEQLTSPDGTNYYYRAKRSKRLVGKLQPSDVRINEQGNAIPKLRDKCERILSKVPHTLEVSAEATSHPENLTALKKDVKSFITEITQLKKSIDELKKPRQVFVSEGELTKELEHLVIFSFLKINRLRMRFNDHEWNQFRRDVGLDALYELAQASNFEVDEIHEICSFNDFSISATKQSYDLVLKQLLQGINVDPSEIEAKYNIYARALEIAVTERALIADKLAQPLVIKDFSEIEVRNYFQKRFPDQYIDIYNVLTDKKAMMVYLMSSIEKLKDDLLAHTGDQLRTLESAARCARNQGVLNKLRQLEDQISCLPSNTRISDRINLQMEYAIQLRRAITVLEGDLEDNQYLEQNAAIDESFREFLTPFQESIEELKLKEGKALERLSELSSQDENLAVSLQQSVAMGIRQQVIQWIKEPFQRPFQKAAGSEENTFLSSFLSEQVVASETKTAQNLRDMLQQKAGWRGLPEFQVWERWVHSEYSKLSQASSALPDLKTSSVQEILTFLNQESSLDPKRYNEVLWRQFTTQAMSETGLCKNLNDMRTGQAGWRDLSQYRAWKQWVHSEYARLAIVSPTDLIDLENSSMEEVLSFLSRILGQNPRQYNQFLFERFSGFARAYTQTIDNIYQMREGEANWRTLPEYESWQRWARAQGRLESLEEHSVEDVLNALSQNQPEKTQDAFFREFISFALTEQALPCHKDTLARATLLALEMDSLFFGEKWTGWVQGRCRHRDGVGSFRSGITLSDESAWKEGGIKCFQAIEMARTDKKTDKLKEDFIQEQIIPTFEKYGIRLDISRARGIMEAMLLLQQQASSSQVSCVKEPVVLADKPKLRSLFCGKDWETWVRGRCRHHNGAGSLREGISEDLERKWIVGGIQYLDEIAEARTDKPNLKREFIEQKVLPLIREYGCDDANPVFANEYIQQFIMSQKLNAFTSMKRKFENFCNREVDQMPTEFLQGAVITYFRALGLVHFTPSLVTQLLLQMKAYKRSSEMTSISSNEAFKANLSSLVDLTTGIHAESGRNLGLNSDQIAAIQECYLSRADAAAALRHSIQARDWDEAVDVVCQQRLQPLKSQA